MRRLLLVVALLAGGLALVPVQSSTAKSPATPALCGRLDLPETGLQGDQPRVDQLSGPAERGDNCGVSLVGYNDLGNRAGNANMAWSGNCAYVAGAGSGIAVVDVSNPRPPPHDST